MKKFLFFVAFTLVAGNLFAQVPSRGVPPPLPFREVSGVVKDTTDNTIPGAVVTLTSAKDTLKTITNSDGIFVFKNVKVATFYLTVSSLGYAPITTKRLENDAVKRLVLAPVILKGESRVLDDVVVNGTPSITYKTDTVEYRASDYKVRENSAVDELLKKMEGFEVGTDGSVLHQGQEVTQARLNGKRISGGDVAATIQSLPADIVEKIQVLDDYGDEAARTGVKSGDPKKILNITTKADRSIGNMARLNAGLGSNERYNTQANLTRLNANQVIQVQGNLNNTVNGVQGSNGGNNNNNGGGSSDKGGNNYSPNYQKDSKNSGGSNGGGGSSGGTTNTGSPSFTYRDNWGEKVEVNMDYSYRFIDRNSISNSETTQFGSKGTTFSTKESNSQNNTDTHNFSFEFEYQIDSANFLKVSPELTYSGSLINTNSSRIQTGFNQQSTIGITSRTNTQPTLSGSLLFHHSFDKKRRSLSFHLSNSFSDQNTDREPNNHILYYDRSTGNLSKDSLVHRLTENDNLARTYRGSLTYVEPLTDNTQMEFNGQVNYRSYDNSAVTSNISAAGSLTQIDSLTNIFNYSFRESRFALNYRYGISQSSKTKFSLGLTAVPAVLSGTKVSLNTTTRRNSFNFVPIVRYQYQWSRTKQFAMNYSGTFQEPTFDQIQPVRDDTDPQNPIVGNPDLKAAFRNNVSMSFNNYIANSRFNYSANVNTTFVTNNVVSNIIDIRDKYQGLIKERRYLNLSGAYSVNGNYNVSKQLADRKYNLQLNGNMNYTHGVAMSNNVQYTSDTWRLNERFGPRITPTDWFEINPNVSFDFTKTNYTLPEATNRLTRTLALNVDGEVEFLKNFMFGYSVSKNYISGIETNISSNPFIINAYFEKEFFKRKNGVLRIHAYDLLNQNNYINRTLLDNGYVDTKTNALSRYFMVSFKLNLQKWSGTPMKNGKPMIRRGDGSFIKK
ncbi:MAG: hypothetical protein K0S09_1735 [Sphingobacteriaceae bacterium]|jgi:hypothetical protein|nr:hypothetical protein [Sphingobacteriaceae bacterium]